MTAAYRMRGLGWFLAVVVVVLGFYLVSLQVAAERKKLDDVNRAIAATQRHIRGLDTEFDTRANLAQLERWNGNVLALAAPVAGQFMGDEAQLAQVDFRPGASGAPAVAHANYVVPALPVDADRPQPGEGAGRAGGAAPSAAPVAAPVLASLTVPARPAPRAMIAATAGAAQARPAVVTASSTSPITPPRRPRTLAMVDRKTVRDATLSDLLSRADISTGKAH